ncbi:MAG: hypothetical protein PWP23_2219 [Candidatus Sumerlaeota bacterium]|nr:hypothetical protein [Candidatus Sumerlaeota bacterium]
MTAEELQILLQNADSHVRKGEMAEALQLYANACQSAPTSYAAFMGAGFCYWNMGNLVAAQRFYQRACELKPGASEAHHNLGEVLLGLRVVEKAEEHFRQAVETASERDARFAASLVSWARCCRSKGNFEDARSKLTEALAADPNNVEALSLLVSMGHTAPDSSLLQELRAQASREDLPEKLRSTAWFTLGKASEDGERYAEAFDCYRRAHEARHMEFPRGMHEQFVAQLRGVFRSELFDEREGWGTTESPTPVFVVGMPRSGTSLVEQVLASHPAVHGADELMLFGLLLHQMESGVGGATDYYPAVVTQMIPQHARMLGSKYLAGVRSLAPDKDFVVDKMPANFFQIGMIKLALPHARVIHCVRNMWDIALSCYATNFDAVHPFTSNLESLGVYLRTYAELMNHWDRVLPGFVHHVSYEDLVAEPQKEIDKLLDFVGIDHHEACYTPHRTKRQVMTASAWQVRQPIYNSSVARWKRFAAQLEPLFAEVPSADWHDYQ